MAIIGVMGSGEREWEELAAPLGIWIAQNGHHLLTGGGDGVMLAVSRAFAGTPGRRGRCMGVVPTQPDKTHGFVALEDYHNPYVDLAVLTPLPKREASAAPSSLSRNMHQHIDQRRGHAGRDRAGHAVRETHDVL